jgi:hypothetical protein
MCLQRGGDLVDVLGVSFFVVHARLRLVDRATMRRRSEKENLSFLKLAITKPFALYVS